MIKKVSIIILIILFSTLTTAFNIDLIETTYLPNTTIVGKINITIDNLTESDQEISIKIDNQEITKTTLKNLLDLNQITYNVTPSKFTLTGNSLKTITQSTLLGFSIPSGLINLTEIIVSGSNALEPTIDIGNDNSNEWAFLGQSTSFNQPITGNNVNLQSETGNFILATKDKFLCSLVNLPLTKDIKVEAKYKLNSLSRIEGNIVASLFSIGQDGISAFGGSDECDLPEPNTNSEFRSCNIRLSTVVSGNNYICISTKTDRPDEADLYSIPIDDKSDSSFVCSGSLEAGQLACAKAQGGDFFTKASTGNYNKILNGNTNFDDWLTTPDSIRFAMQSQLTNCVDNCLVPIKVSLKGGSLNIDKFRVRSSNFETESLFDGIFQKAKFSTITNINLTDNRTDLTLLLNALNLRTDNLTLGNHILKITIGNEQREQEFKIASTTTTEKFTSIKTILGSIKTDLENSLSTNQILLLKLDKKSEIETTINTIKLKLSELNNIENQTIPSSEKEKKAEEIFESLQQSTKNLPKLILERGKATDQQVVSIEDLRGLTKLDEVELFFEQKKIITKIEMEVLEVIDYTGNKKLKTFVTLETTANDDLNEADYLVIVPTNLRNLVENINELNHEKGKKVIKKLNKGEKFKTEFEIEGNQIENFYNFKVLYLPYRIEPVVKAECGNKVCETPLENKFTCPIDCKIQYPPILWTFIISIITIAAIISFIIFLFTKEKPPQWIIKIKSKFIREKDLTKIETYISNCIKRKIQEDKIRKALLEKGWKKEDIETAFKNVKKR
ncbi:hypothetical protein HY498_01515 [Candidatus Woesearchaeota archaeon]|nr:hypothetical protein [Candidatus Woesearchaeota archaeon]